MPTLPYVLTLLACADVVEQELFDAELDNRDLQLTTLSARLDTLEATVSAQADLIAAQDAALTALGQSLSAEDDALAARIDAVEARDDGQDDAITQLEGEAAVLGSAVEGVAADGETLFADMAALETRVADVESTVAGIPRGVDLSGIEADVTDLDARVTSMESNGRVWRSGGLATSGTCALVTVDVTEATTVIVAGTASADLDLSWSTVASRYADATGTYLTGPSAPYAQLEATVTASASSSSWTEASSAATSLQAVGYVGDVSPYYGDSGSASTGSQVSVFDTVSLPAAGTYTIRMDLHATATGTGSLIYPGYSYAGGRSGTWQGSVSVTDCNLVVIDP